MASTECWSWPAKPSTQVISVGRQRFSTMRCSPTASTLRPAGSMPTPWSSWPTARSVRPGAISF
ncbi:Uncharacterised protein [Mycobacterium tuberculosis]|nr:Uncharacterised protein [Mycobacterium tuberculosis]